ncbi:MAG TPA: ABC transporter ATP-binding protein [Opitutaceae bacterium]|nr:ABC transporter ATP-binding protein [Opitutaceae bacterium]
MGDNNDTATRQPAIEVRRLTKDYPLAGGRQRVRAVDDISLRVFPGEVFGLLGPNGSGKSTTLKALLGLLTPTLGECFLAGRPGSDPAAHRAIGYLPEAPYFPRFLNGRELLRFHARLAGVPRAGREQRIDHLIERVGLARAADRRVGSYSKGMLQRIGLAQALVADPPILILDEPTAGVDPVGAADIAALVLEQKARGKTILLCSHLLSQIEEVCDRVAILHRGRLLAEGALDELLGHSGRQSLVVENLPAEELAAFGEWLAQRGGRLHAVERPATRLDRYFLETVERAERAGEATR